MLGVASCSPSNLDEISSSGFVEIDNTHSDNKSIHQAAINLFSRITKQCDDKFTLYSLSTAGPVLKQFKGKKKIYLASEEFNPTELDKLNRPDRLATYTYTFYIISNYQRYYVAPQYHGEWEDKSKYFDKSSYELIKNIQKHTTEEYSKDFNEYNDLKDKNFNYEDYDKDFDVETVEFVFDVYKDGSRLINVNNDPDFFRKILLGTKPLNIMNPVNTMNLVNNYIVHSNIDMPPISCSDFDDNNLHELAYKIFPF
jgi:hypothetical protein